MQRFAPQLIRWQKQHGRHNLPWQVSDPYKIWLSEIMLQQTQVATVLDYYPRFLARFPNVAALAAAEQDQVLGLWAGLGYYSRARNLHKAAQQVMTQFNGEFPRTRSQLEQLCGVGRSTAAAISAFAYKQRETILDGNVKRVLSRLFAITSPINQKATEQQLWQLAENLLPTQAHDMPAYTQGLMDLGATVCKRSKPLCASCPVQNLCQAHAQGIADQLPHKEKSNSVRRISQYWLLVRSQNRLLLEKRQQRGIWAGLYCVPVFDTLDALYQCVQNLGASEHDLHEHTGFQHRLTHRLLDIVPFSIELSAPPTQHAEQFYTPAQYAELGLPKPLNTLLQHA